MLSNFFLKYVAAYLKKMKLVIIPILNLTVRQHQI